MSQHPIGDRLFLLAYLACIGVAVAVWLGVEVHRAMKGIDE